MHKETKQDHYANYLRCVCLILTSLTNSDCESSIEYHKKIKFDCAFEKIRIGVRISMDV